MNVVRYTMPEDDDHVILNLCKEGQECIYSLKLSSDNIKKS